MVRQAHQPLYCFKSGETEARRIPPPPIHKKDRSILLLRSLKFLDPIASLRMLQDDTHEITPLRCLRGIDAYGVSGFGSAMPECKHSVAAFALHATLAGSSVKSLQYWNDIPEEI